MSKASCFFFGDQLIQSLCSFSDIDRKRDDTVMRKVKVVVTYVRSDKKKLAAILARSIIFIGIFSLRTETGLATMFVSE